jgi:hypothetical protein
MVEATVSELRQKLEAVLSWSNHLHLVEYLEGKKYNKSSTGVEARKQTLLYQKLQRRKNLRPVRLAYQPPASSIFLSEQISHHSPATRQQYFSLRTNQHQPSATSQTNRLLV